MRISRRSLVLGQAGIQLLVLLWCAIAPDFALAYERPLTDDQVRQAYFLGQDLKSVNVVLAPYLKSLPVPSSGPDVAEVELSTPFAQVVEDSAQHTVSYSAQDAAAAYRQRGDRIEVRIKILFTPTSTNYGEDFWSQVSVGLVQKGQHTGAIGVSGEPIYSADAIDSTGDVIGANVYVQFSVAGVASAPLQVEVVPPGGAAVHAKFDLSQLR